MGGWVMIIMVAWEGGVSIQTQDFITERDCLVAKEHIVEVFNGPSKLSMFHITKPDNAVVNLRCMLK